MVVNRAVHAVALAAIVAVVACGGTSPSELQPDQKVVYEEAGQLHAARAEATDLQSIHALAVTSGSVFFAHGLSLGQLRRDRTSSASDVLDRWTGARIGYLGAVADELVWIADAPYAMSTVAVSPTRLADLHPRRIGRDGADTYFAVPTNRGLSVVRTNGAGTVELARVEGLPYFPEGALTQDANAVYVTTYSEGGGEAGLYRIAKRGGEIRRMARREGGCLWIVSDGEYVYAGCDNPARRRMELHRYSIANDTLHVLASELGVREDSAQPVFLEGGFLYGATDTDTSFGTSGTYGTKGIVRVSLASGAIEPVVTMEGERVILAHAHDARDADGLYLATADCKCTRFVGPNKGGGMSCALFDCTQRIERVSLTRR